MTRAPETLLVAALAASVFAQTGADVVRITAGLAEIRSAPSETAPLLRHVTEGTYLILIKEDAVWFQVQLPESRGLRALGYLARTNAVKVKPAEAASAIDAMRNPSSTRSPGESIAVGAELSPKTIWLKAQATQRFPIAETVRSVDAAASSVSVTSVLSASEAGVHLFAVSLPPDVHDATWIWVTRAPPPAPALTSRHPSFFITYGEVPGLNSNEWAPYVVRVAPAGEWRVISALAGSAIAHRQSQSEWEVRRLLMQHEMASTIRGLNFGMVRLTLNAPLPPGEYAVVIRPAFMRRTYSGRDILGDDGPGVAFGAAWMFVVK